MILPDHEINRLCFSHGLVLPYVRENLQPASIDLRLSSDFRVFVEHNETHIDLVNGDDTTRPVTIEEDGYFTLHPGEFVLGATVEYIHLPDDIVGRVEGKSSLGRMGLIVHATAGFVDPGFNGVITLEMANLRRLPLLLRPGMLIGQISFQQMMSPAEKPYDGKYQNAGTVQASRYGQ